jgi:hypothetical protein
MMSTDQAIRRLDDVDDDDDEDDDLGGQGRVEFSAPQQAAPRQPISEEALERLVYLVGCPRSGTTIITRCFYLSDRVFSMPNRTSFTHHIWRYRNALDRRLLRIIFRMPNFYNEKKTARSLGPEGRARLERRIHKAFAAKDLRGMYQLYPLVFSLDPTCQQRPERATCWADKGNDVYGIFEMARAMPRARFVFIIRDPRATVASMQGQVVRSREEIGLDGTRLTALVTSSIYWRHLTQTFLQLAARYPDRVKFVYYEDFVRDASETINSAIEFGAGERMSSTTLDAALAEYKFKTKHDKSTTGSGIDTRPLERWREMLSDAEVKIVAAITGRTARKLGYDIVPASRRVALGALSRLDTWRSRLASAAKYVFLEVREPTIRPSKQK